MESLSQGLSGMDAARGAMGQGWPFARRPWNSDGAREPRHRRGRMSGALSLWLLSLCANKEKVTRREGENQAHVPLEATRLNSLHLLQNKVLTEDVASNKLNPPLS